MAYNTLFYATCLRYRANYVCLALALMSLNLNPLSNAKKKKNTNVHHHTSRYTPHELSRSYETGATSFNLTLIVFHGSEG